MRIKVLALIALMIAGAFVSGCMNIQTDEESRKAIQDCYSKIAISNFEPVLAVTGPRGGQRSGREKAFVLIRHDDGHYYVINMNDASAHKVGGIKPCSK